MVLSMTGVGKATVRYNGRAISAFIKTLNSKQIDISTRIAPRYREREVELRSILSEVLGRGKVEFHLSLEDEEGGLLGVQQINQDALQHYLQGLRRVCLDNPDLPLPSVDSLLRLPGVLASREEASVADISEDEWKYVREAVYEAAQSVVVFRKQEGLMLQTVLSERIQNITLLLEKIAQPEAQRIEHIRARIEEALAKTSLSGYDQGRLEQEMIYYIEKLDINEEKDRLRHHLAYFIQVMTSGEMQGKTLGFIAQEIGREINTLGSKSNNAEMQQLVVQMKDELEQIKEQTLNVL
ncbi:MAG: DUF1732 domain-containing protein [Porphyromonadaceae bacterium]|nr:DUF1732 domain-containing protein [Porphyromonadaceae bacterium]